ncbi:hypothetical protein CY34DRAFT_16938 [Suillus luteus UH-Slu-Lm8-n1]|uniref:Uncharacterized protein n=1 Tax=Suillus luteus UH-Slu-Lm8-n1 TaxID=930992 RepID=A0A0D0AUK6_9AGAM|nr:hypothetical protein CY34DRAFT_16938 [Suillus luteus UH-Slu-Lm8-n1]
MALKRKRQASSSRKTLSTSNSHPSTSESQQMESSRKPSPTLAVNSILQELLGGPAGSSSAYRKANSEANQGLRSASQSQKTQTVPKSKLAHPPDYQFTAAEIIFIPCGTKQPKKSLHSYIPLLTPVLRNPQVPSLVEVQTLEVMKLAKTDHVNGIVISKNWSFMLFDLELRKFFPRLFLYLDGLVQLPNPQYKEHQDGSIPSSVLEGWAKGKGKEKMSSLPSRSASLGSESESTSDDSDDDSISSKSSLSEPPRKSKYRRGLTGIDDEILPASDLENLSESATIVDLTASDNEDTGNFFSSFNLGEQKAVAKPEVPVEADLAPFEQALSPGPISTPSLDTGEIFATPLLQASGSFAIDPSLDNPWEGNCHFDF